MPPPLMVRKFESFDEWIHRPRSRQDSTGLMSPRPSFRARCGRAWSEGPPAWTRSRSPSFARPAHGRPGWSAGRGGL